MSGAGWLVACVLSHVSCVTLSYVMTMLDTEGEREREREKKKKEVGKKSL